jgi:mycofactocin precursor
MDDRTVADHGTISPSTAPSSSTIAPEQVADTALLEDELLVEEISIDGMCGVY